MKNLLKYSASAFCALVLSSQAHALTLEEAVRISIETYPEISERLAISRESANNVDASYARYLPTLDLSAAAGPEYTNNTSTRSRTARTQDSQQDHVWVARRELSLTLNQTIFDGFSRESEIARREAILLSNQLTTIDTAEVLALDVVRAYVDITRFEEILTLAYENLQRHQEILDDVRNRVDGGQAGISDLQQAVAREANARARIAVQERSLDEAKILFERVVGVTPEGLERPDIDPAILPADVDAAVEEALETSPLIKSLQAQVLATKEDIGVTEAAYYPTISFEVAGSRNEGLDGVEGINEDLTALLRVDYNLYSGGGDVDRARAAKSRHSESRFALQRQSLQVQDDMKQSWSEMIRREEESLARSDQLIANSQVVASYNQEFQIGQRDLLDLLDSENELFNTQSEMLSAEYESLYSRYRILAVLGKLTDTLQVNVPVELAEADLEEE